MKTTGMFFIIAANTLGGLSYVWGKKALEGLPAATVTFGRTAIAVALMLLLLLFRGGLRWPFSAAETLRLSMVGIFAYAAPLLLGQYGVEASTAGNGSILILLEPLSILLFSWLLLREKVGALQLLGIAAGLAGALCIVSEETGFGDLLNSRHARGNIILAVHGLLWGLYTPLLKPIAARHDPLLVTFAPMAIALLPLSIACGTEHALWKNSPALGSSLVWTACLGVLVSFGSTFLWNASLKHLPASAIAPFVFLQPLVGLLEGYRVLGETPTAAVIGGGALILAGVVLVIWPTPSTPPPGQSDGMPVG